MLAILIDFIYQLIVLHWFYPGQALIVAVILPILPYLFCRGLLSRIARRWHRPVPPETPTPATEKGEER